MRPPRAARQPRGSHRPRGGFTGVAGFTMVEMVASMVILGLLAAVTAPILSGGIRNYFQAVEMTQEDANARLALERMLRDLRWVKSSSDLTTLTPSQLSFVDTGGNTVTFTYDSVAKTLSRQQNGGNINILANNVSSFTLSYLATDGQSTATLASQVLYVTIQMTISTSGNQPYSAQYMSSVRLYNA